MKFVELDKTVHNIHAFDCGKSNVNNFLYRTASKDAQQLKSKTFVLIDEADPSTIIGYYTTMLDSQPLSSFPKMKDAKRSVPMLFLGMMGVALKYQGNELGCAIVAQVLLEARLLSDHIALYGVMLDAIDDQTATGFYIGKNGFSRLTENPLKLYITIGTIKERFP